MINIIVTEEQKELILTSLKNRRNMFSIENPENIEKIRLFKDKDRAVSFLNTLTKETEEINRIILKLEGLHYKETYSQSQI